MTSMEEYQWRYRRPAPCTKHSLKWRRVVATSGAVGDGFDARSSRLQVCYCWASPPAS
jgi:hypothetical protein